ncbi:calcium-independent phospholipase A2 VIA [Oratosquilla oratoria]|uniref:calcium-independent phospholipase A2 VIA n=1 Tax=Oratosquilla oratoria TaxID=337810 RepID=UPI003F766CB0
MAFLGSLVRTFFSSDASTSGETVIEVSTNEYTRMQVQAREDSLVLYGPNSANKFDLVLNKPVENSLTRAFSLCRISSFEDAQSRFLALKDVIPILAELMAYEVLNQATLQSLSDLIRLNPTWKVTHVAAHMGYSRILSNPQVARHTNSLELEMRLSPLHIAVSRQHRDVIQVLLESGASVDSTDGKGNSAYHYAANTNKAIIEMITKKNSRLLNTPNEEGKTPLHLACESGNQECVKALLCAGADVNIAAKHDSSLPIHTATKSNSALCAKEIITMYPKQLNAQDMKAGGTPLHWASSKEIALALIELGCNINARNSNGMTALHNMALNNLLPCVIILLSHGAAIRVQDDDGNSPLHLASSPAVLQALLVFGADINRENNKGETARHLIASRKIRDSDQMLYFLHAVGATRCLRRMSTCTQGCWPNGSFDGVPPEVNSLGRARTNYDDLLDEAMCGELSSALRQPPPIGFTPDRGCRILCLDGGGMKGLVLIQLLAALEEVSGCGVLDLFDWVAGTSTGGILALGLVKGKSTRYMQGLYFRMKDAVFKGTRPYDEKPLEKILMEELGEHTVMSELRGPKVVVTGVLADRFPADLHLFRNYESGEQILQATEGNGFVPTSSPDQQLVWRAARASGAAPSYFRAYGRFIDGGLISNNPTLDLLTEIAEHNVALNAVGRGSEVSKPIIVVSLGTGKPPVSKVEAIDCFRPESIWGTVRMAFGLSNMAKLLIDQATMADNRTVDRARAWCAMCGIKYSRLSPQLSLDIQLDETSDEILVNMLWEAMEYIHRRRQHVEQLAAMLCSRAQN